MSRRPTILPRRAGETDSERRLREALNRTCGQALAALDAAMNLRTAPQEAQKVRHLARSAMTDFCTRAMTALAFAEETALPDDENTATGA